MLDIKIDARRSQAQLTALDWAVSSFGTAAWMASTMAPFLRDRANDRFAGEGDEVVGQWMPLMESTNDIRESEGFPREHPINRRTGELEEFITNNPGAITKTGVETVLTLPDAEPTGELASKLRTAQQGRSRPYTRRRPVLALGAVDLEYALLTYGTFIEQTVQRAR